MQCAPESQEGTECAKEKGKAKLDEGDHTMYMDEDGKPSTPIVSNVVHNLFISPHTQKIAELESQLAQLRLQQAA